jgi:hypothetical protein
MDHYKAPQGQHGESLGLLCCAGVECRGKICIPGQGRRKDSNPGGFQLLCHVLCWLLL